jgi:S1-C subfamily serine protease
VAPPAVLEPVAPASPSAGAEARFLPNSAVGHDAVAAINFAPLSERLKDYFGAQSGVLVVSAGPGAPFNLQDGDVVVSIDGRVPADGPHAARILRSYQPGERVKLRVQRDRRVMDLDVQAPAARGN